MNKTNLALELINKKIENLKSHVFNLEYTQAGITEIKETEAKLQVLYELKKELHEL